MKPNEEHLDFALVQHSKAIKSFRQSLAEGGTQVRHALMASLLLGCFESFHGNWQTASQQIYGGLNILEQLEQGKVKGTPAPAAITIDSELGVAMARLQLQLESFLAMNPMNDQPVTELEDVVVDEDIPPRFASLAESFSYAINAATYCIRHARRAYRYLNGLAYNQAALERERQTLCDYVYRWRRAYNHILLEAWTGMKVLTRDYLGILQLHICVMGFEIMLATTLSKEEMIFDLYTEEFSRMMVYARRLFEVELESRAQTTENLKAQFGLGLIMTMYFLATRCRDSLIRRDAIALLRERPCKNGIWDSLQAAEVAEWIMRLEEEGYQGCDTIPEEARVRMSSLKTTVGKRVIKVECLHGLYGRTKKRMAKLGS